MRRGHIRSLLPIFICWFLWIARNRKKYENERMEAHNIILKVLNLIHLTGSAQPFEKFHWHGDLNLAMDCNNTVKPAPRRKCKEVYWDPPNRGVLKLNTDGAFRQKSSQGACGGII